ncbi:MAG TPA: hypothetical protein GX714_00070 [Chloroflexi bacterium]|nr:hypothetical protein [Chloroflexota bacterium]
MVIGVAALAMAAGALLIALGRRASLGRWLLTLGALGGLLGMLVATVRSGEDVYLSTITAAAGTLTFAAFWSVALVPPAPRAQVGYGLLAAGGMGGYLLSPRYLAAPAVLRDVSYGLSAWAYVAGAGVLVAGLAHTFFQHASTEQGILVNPYLTLAMLCLTVSLAAQGAATQWAWGSLWVGDPAEYLRLVGWIVVALGWVIATEFGRHERAAVWSLRMAAGIVIVVILGSMALIQALGLSSLYLAA